MMQAGGKSKGERTNFDGIGIIDPYLPDYLKFCGWMKTSWGAQCHVNSDIAQYSHRKYTDRDPCIRFRKEWLTIEEFKVKKMKELHEKEVAYKAKLHERVSNLAS